MVSSRLPKKKHLINALEHLNIDTTDVKMATVDAFHHLVHLETQIHAVMLKNKQNALSSTACYNKVTVRFLMPETSAIVEEDTTYGEALARVFTRYVNENI